MCFVLNMPFKNQPLNDGTSIPPIAFGSSSIPHTDTVRQIHQAFDAGFRHVDTAQGESLVGSV